MIKFCGCCTGNEEEILKLYDALPIHRLGFLCEIFRSDDEFCAIPPGEYYEFSTFVSNFRD